jgi:kynureninase
MVPGSKCSQPPLNMAEPNSIEYARELDRKDPLRSFRQEFVMEDPGLVYLDGNSLGRLPKKSVQHLERTIGEQWGRKLISSWNEHWYDLPVRLGKMIARIIGARPEEVIIGDSTSVNLYKLAFAALKLREGRKEIVSDEMNFPTDLYILQGLIRQSGGNHKLRLLKSPDGISMEMSELQKMIQANTALISLSQVAYRSSYLYDMKQVNDLAHEHDALVLWDLSHSAGVVPVDLNGTGADMAVGCTYKYLNGGPGSPAFLYVRRELQEQLENPIQGWFGEQDPFEFSLQYRKSEGIRKFLTGTPPVISLSGLEPALEMILKAGTGAIRQKSESQGEYLLTLARQWLLPEGAGIGSPELIERRGSHISLKHKEAYRICKALTDPGLGDGPVIPDFREPDNIRLGISPLYTSYEDILRAMMQLREILSGKLYENYSRIRDQVT